MMSRENQQWSSEITRAVIGWKGVFYQSTEHGAELKLSRHLPIRIMSSLFR